MTEPTYSFPIPSLHDDTPLDCRIYHPPGLHDLVAGDSKKIRGAIVGHPYAPLGGSYDDHVVLSVTECLLDQGYVVTTFNFRGAGHSAGKTSWTGRPEIDDFCSIIGLLYYYLSTLVIPVQFDILASVDQSSFDGPLLQTDADTTGQASLELLLAGYSFASLVLCRLPAVFTILNRFKSAENGTAATEIFLRARTLAIQHRKTIATRLQRGRRPSSTSPSKPAHWRNPSHVILGGEESELASSRRRHSRGDSRGSFEAIRELPRTIKSHMHRPRSGQFHLRTSSDREQEQQHNTVSSEPQKQLHQQQLQQQRQPISIRYLLISPVLIPLSTTLVPPGIPFISATTTATATATAAGGGRSTSLETEEKSTAAGVFSLQYPTLIAFGSSDTFTSSKKLCQWAERLAKDSAAVAALATPATTNTTATAPHPVDAKVEWTQIDGAGHFWREGGVMRELQGNIREWVAK
ncbi:uncharacterized protein SEPMUDRAFT_152636 [Sphaerulina musiva SO2202]|uniref:Alpha/beta-hydrolase n=1 Tax=Sphaerulina musiva (strain SO2202) TaxID=692275 RepID=N1QM50_SPHMS|nr:uncharacterized protein SEPMUDRAFT_152636 [Sphaerulina musiva SO2202]EMF16409.1 hypothetical protein SEPMUDRAFT_152636 [Sphaerulina musiva SO2202]